MMIRRFFLRSYLLFAFSIAGIGLLVDHLLLQQKDGASAWPYRSLALAIKQSVAGINDSHKNARIEFLLVRLGQQTGLTFQFWESDDINFDATQLDELNQLGYVHLVSDQERLTFFSVPQWQGYIATVNEMEEDRSYAWLWFYLLLSVPLFLFIYPITKDLTKLQMASKQMSEGAFSSRVNLHPSSSIYSIGLGYNQMAERIDYLLEEQRALINAVSHEFKTPLARLQFGLEKLKKTYHDPETIMGMAQDIREINELIHELLSYTKLENVESVLEYQHIEIEPWLKSIIEDTRIAAPISVEIDCRIKTVYSDPHLLARAASNLLTNAFRYAQSKIRIEIHIADKGYAISISDDGPGIKVADRKRIFEPFSRLDESRTKHSGGYGLGLAIVKRITERLRGNVTLTESPEGGAKFTLELQVG